MRVFTYADGLPRSNVLCIERDSRGFMWFCTADGLSRYDGYRFETLTVADGLPRRQVTSVLQTRSGLFLAGTLGGIAGARMPAGGTLPGPLRAIPVSGGPPRGILALLESRSGVVWAATYGGLYRLSQIDPVHPQFEFLDLGQGIALAVTALAEDAAGTLWMATSKGLWRVPNGGTPSPVPSLPTTVVGEVLVDHHGDLWAAGQDALWQIPLSGSGPQITAVHGRRNGLTGSVARVFESAEGSLWAATSSGLSEWVPALRRWRSWGADDGFPGWGGGSIGEDSDGNLWVGADHGLARLARQGFSRFTAAEGAGRKSISGIFEHQGRLHVVTNERGGPRVLTYQAGHFSVVRPRYAPSLVSSGWGGNQRALVDRRGAWWIATGEGLYHFPPGTNAELLADATPEVLLPGKEIYRIYEDRSGAIWAAPIGHPLSRWDPTSATIQCVPVPGPPGYISAFAEDSSGSLWLALSNDLGNNLPSALLRFRQGRFERLSGPNAGGLQAGWISALLLDGTGSLWVATSERGLLRSLDPTAANPHFQPVTATLSNSVVSCLAQAPDGSIFTAGPRGLERIDPVSGDVRRWTVSQGYPDGDCAELHFDHGGSLWAGTTHGLGRMSFAPPPPERPPAVFLTSLQAGGHDLSSLLATSGTTPEIPSQSSELELHYVSPGAVSGRPVRYRYRLLGVGNLWSAPLEERSVHFGRLPAGHYEFQVQALSETGRQSTPASFAFLVPQPFWRSAWFLTSVALALLAALAAVEWIRQRRRRQLERLRARIARDLHDDLGAGLSRIAILSETLQLRPTPTEQVTPLRDIAAASRDIVKSMSDIVWAIDPGNDRWSSLARRLRELCARLFEPRSISWHVEIDETAAAAALPIDRRRHLYLIAKEALTNAARHSSATRVTVTLRHSNHQWLLIVDDDGIGFDPGSVEPGNGLANLHHRAAELGASLQFIRPDTGGTRVLCSVPARRGLLQGFRSWI